MDQIGLLGRGNPVFVIGVCVSWRPGVCGGLGEKSLRTWHGHSFDGCSK